MASDITLDGACAGMSEADNETMEYKDLVNCFFSWLRNVKCGYALTFDGKAGGQDNTYDVPKDLYTTHDYISSGNSSFRRVIGKSSNIEVFESLYVKKGKTE